MKYLVFYKCCKWEVCYIFKIFKLYFMNYKCKLFVFWLLFLVINLVMDVLYFICLYVNIFDLYFNIWIKFCLV